MTLSLVFFHAFNFAPLERQAHTQSLSLYNTPGLGKTVQVVAYLAFLMSKQVRAYLTTFMPLFHLGALMPRALYIRLSFIHQL